jgi:hypothetical protein
MDISELASLKVVGFDDLELESVKIKKWLELFQES